MYQTESKDIYKRLAAKYGLPESEIHAIVKSPFEFVIKCMKESNPFEGRWTNVEIIGFGKFGIKPHRIEVLKEYKKRSRRDKELKARTSSQDNRETPTESDLSGAQFVEGEGQDLL